MSGLVAGSGGGADPAAPPSSQLCHASSRGVSARSVLVSLLATQHKAASSLGSREGPT